jgi:hypothetical protein
VTISKRERRLLALLGVVAAAVAFRWLWNAASAPLPAGGSSSSVASARGARGARAARSATEPQPTSVVELEVARLDAPPKDFEVGRDLFRFGPPPPPPEPPPPTAEELAERRRMEEARRLRALEAARLAAIPQPPRVTLRYLGSFGPDGAKIAVLTDSAGKNVWNARVGDIVDGKFIVAAIGLESVDLKFVGFENEPAARLAVGG